MGTIKVYQRGLLMMLLTRGIAFVLLASLLAFLLQWLWFEPSTLPRLFQVWFSLKNSDHQPSLSLVLMLLGGLSLGLLMHGVFLLSYQRGLLGRGLIYLGAIPFFMLVSFFAATHTVLYTPDIVSWFYKVGNEFSGYRVSVQQHFQFVQHGLFFLQKETMIGGVVGGMVGAVLGLLMITLPSRFFQLGFVFLVLVLVGVVWQMMAGHYFFMVWLVKGLLYRRFLLFGLCFLFFFSGFLGRLLVKNTKTLQGLGGVLTGIMGVLGWIMAAFLCLALLPVFFLNGFRQDPQHTHFLMWHLLGLLTLSAVVGLVFSGVLWWLSARYVSAYWVNKLLPRFTRKVRSNEQLMDVRSASKSLPAINLDYDCQRYFTSDHVFFGLSDRAEPLTLSYSQWRQKNVHIMGQPGSGKTAMACVLLVQSILHGDAVFVLEGKDDAWARHVLKAAADAYGRRFIFVDLRDQTPQFNILQHSDPSTLRELFNAGFSQADTGHVADHYKKIDRKYTREVIEHFQVGEALGELFYREVEDNDLLQKAAPGFCLSLEEVATLGCIKTRLGVDFKTVIEQGDVVYVVGSLRDEAIIKLQKMVLIRWIQLIEGRDTTKNLRQVTLFLDEFRFMISSAAMQALATLRDKSGNIILAHQAKGDLRVPAPDLTPESVESSVKTNVAIGIYYRTNDVESQRWISDMTQKILIKKEREKVTRNEALSEQLQSEKTLETQQRNLMTPEMISVMPKHFAVVIGVNPVAEIAGMAPYKTTKQSILITPADPITEVASVKKTIPVLSTPSKKSPAKTGGVMAIPTPVQAPKKAPDEINFTEKFLKNIHQPFPNEKEKMCHDDTYE